MCPESLPAQSRKKVIEKKAAITVENQQVLILRIATAYYLARASLIPKIIISTLAHVPLVLPPVVTGYLLLVLFG